MLYYIRKKGRQAVYSVVFSLADLEVKVPQNTLVVRCINVLIVVCFSVELILFVGSNKE